MKIRREDIVMVISGKDRGKTGKVTRVDPVKQRVYVDGLDVIKRHERPRQVQGTQRAETVGGVIERPRPDPRCSNVALLDPKDNKTDQGRHRPRRRQGLPRRAPLEVEDRLMAQAGTQARLEGPLRAGDPAGADPALRLLHADAGPAHQEDHTQHGRRRRQAGRRGYRGCRPSSSATIAGREDQRPPRAQVGRRLQAPRGHARRPLRDAARRAQLRVPRPPDVDRDPTDPRLPRR